MKKIILVFLDGVGLGGSDPERNPLLPLFTSISPELTQVLSRLPAEFDGGRMSALDACLGVPGIPQSATGQTSLFTGVNAQERLGYHLNAMPNGPLIGILKERSLPVVLKRRGFRAVNGNLHSPGYFRSRRGGHKNRFPVSTIMTMASRTPFLFERDFRRGRGVFMDLTGALLRERGIDIPLITPGEAADRLVFLTEEADFVFFEYFLTDRWGHKRNRPALDRCVSDLALFLGRLKKAARRAGVHVVLTSDHGNAEDFHTGDHTRNPVPFLHLPGGEENVLPEELVLQDLTDVYHAVLYLMEQSS